MVVQFVPIPHLVSCVVVHSILPWGERADHTVGPDRERTYHTCIYAPTVFVSRRPFSPCEPCWSSRAMCIHVSRSPMCGRRTHSRKNQMRSFDGMEGSPCPPRSTHVLRGEGFFLIAAARRECRTVFYPSLAQLPALNPVVCVRVGQTPFPCRLLLRHHLFAACSVKTPK